MQINAKFKSGDKVKVLARGGSPLMEDMLGGIFEVKVQYSHDSIAVWNDDKSDFWYF